MGAASNTGPRQRNGGPGVVQTHTCDACHPTTWPQLAQPDPRYAWDPRLRGHKAEAWPCSRGCASGTYLPCTRLVADHNPLNCAVGGEHCAQCIHSGRVLHVLKLRQGTPVHSGGAGDTCSKHPVAARRCHIPRLPGREQPLRVLHAQLWYSILPQWLRVTHITQ